MTRVAHCMNTWCVQIWNFLQKTMRCITSFHSVALNSKTRVNPTYVSELKTLSRLIAKKYGPDSHIFCLLLVHTLKNMHEKNWVERLRSDHV